MKAQTGQNKGRRAGLAMLLFALLFLLVSCGPSANEPLTLPALELRLEEETEGLPRFSPVLETMAAESEKETNMEEESGTMFTAEISSESMTWPLTMPSTEAPVSAEAETTAAASSAEEVTEAPTETITEALTEAVTEAPTDPATEAPVESSTEASAEAPTEPPTEASTETVTEAPAETHTEPPTNPPSVGEYIDIWVGDSRLVSMGQFFPEGHKNDLIIAANSKAYAWFTGEALPRLKEALENQHVRNVFIAMGVNDCASSYRYSSKTKAADYSARINELVEEYPAVRFYVCSVGPCDGESYGAVDIASLNQEIHRFNEEMQSLSRAAYIDCGEYLERDGFQTTDGIHYNSATYRKWLAYVLSQVE